MVGRQVKVVVFVAVVLLCFGCDRATKIVAQDALQDRPPQPAFGSTVVFEYEENTGAMLSIGAQLSPTVRFWLFTVGISVMLMVLGLFIFVRSRSAGEIAAGALAVGGGLGNLFDRLTCNGAVIDFVSVGLGPLRTAIFNLADVAILAGVVLYLAALLRRSAS